jgi:AraC-like DNA-binding protein
MMRGAVTGALQRAGPIAQLDDLLSEVGVSASLVAEGTGVDLATLTVESRIPFSAVLALLERAAEQSSCHHLGLLLGARYAVASHGEIAQLSGRASTLRQALLAFVGLQPGYSSGAAVYLNRLGRDFVFGYGIYDRTAPGSAQLYDCVLAFGCTLLRELTGGHVSPVEILFCHRQPDDTEPYRRVLKAPLRFNQTQAGIVIGGDAIDCHLTRSPLNLVNGKGLRANERVEAPDAARVRHLIRPLLLAGDASMDGAARALGLLPRTLRRHLAAEGQTFEGIRDDVRYVLARELLALTDLPMGEISASLLFSNQPAFARAFRRWSGTTPTLWRKSLAQF